MSEIIRLFPSRLNLNGDQANALVLQRRAAWAGVSIEVLDYEDISTLRPLITRLQQAKAPAVVLLGHGSLAAMASIAHLKDEVEELLAVCKGMAQSVIVVGSSAEWLLEHTSGERVSEFWVGSVNYEDRVSNVFGYLNSEAIFDPIYVDGSLLYTLLHGPLLAKSEDLADHLMVKLLGKKIQSAPAEVVSSYVAEAIKTAKS